jgi:hypothetical protein
MVNIMIQYGKNVGETLELNKVLSLNCIDVLLHNQLSNVMEIFGLCDLTSDKLLVSLKVALFDMVYGKKIPISKLSIIMEIIDYHLYKNPSVLEEEKKKEEKNKATVRWMLGLD